ncbi:MAG: AMP-dependent synthetase [Acidobacteria bacterium RIFCSPLOWO2_02_FULL_67_36]|nr:MAG: AMP-dependent synthetase [Acidobacteria bacterium RIFCSPLOWO2_02_FULL_67_36]OFW25522.1 MAG: AMP-dependent synthetase [Acidobacteria bacterium RIFCSPLOWO2_12_FULL_66_21]
MGHAETLDALLQHGSGAAPAFGTPGAPSLTYDALRALVGATVQRLNRWGVGRNDRVAIVLPSGPQMAAALCAVAAGATAAPLNPAYRADEFHFYLTDLQPKMLIVEASVPSPARSIATDIGVPIAEVRPESHRGAGTFTLEALSANSCGASAPGLAAADDVALVLHTSGTTSRPKIVPLTQRNITASARHIITALDLSASDVCLNIMPLFHIHGLMAAVLSTLGSGGHVVCPPAFNPLRFFEWMKETQPTWYTAVPSMHYAILARAERHADAVAGSRLRFIRSSSAPLDPHLMTRVEQTFQAPVIESYGMTEASHQIASNPLPPRPRKAGSVGLPAGAEVAILDETGRPAPPEEIGEVVIRGPNVTPGYADNPEANAAAYVDGWLRTGDQGRLDRDGYLWLTGRLKELINRGGEKVSPLEIEAVMRGHPHVQQVVAFAMPDASLGEEVAAAVVRVDGSDLTTRELRRFTAERLADFKVPRRIVFVPELPKGVTGKVQRIGLAKTLGLV